jgi:hypothetical protein
MFEDKSTWLLISDVMVKYLEDIDIVIQYLYQE